MPMLLDALRQIDQDGARLAGCLMAPDDTPELLGEPSGATGLNAVLLMGAMLNVFAALDMGPEDVYLLYHGLTQQDAKDSEAATEEGVDYRDAITTVFRDVVVPGPADRHRQLGADTAAALPPAD